MERFKVIASIYGFFIRNNTILLLRRQNTGYEDGNYGLPAGHVENNEPLTSAFCREIKEEIDINLKREDITLVHVMHRKKEDIRLDFFFFVEKWDKEPRNAEPEKCNDLQWFPIDDLPVNTIPYIKTAIQNYTLKKFYSEVGW